MGVESETDLQLMCFWLSNMRVNDARVHGARCSAKTASVNKHSGCRQRNHYGNRRETEDTNS